MSKSDDKRKAEKEKLMKDLFSKPRNFSNSLYDDSLDILKDSENELNRLLEENQKMIDQMVKDFNYSDDDLKLLRNEIERDFNVKIESPETVVVGKASKEVFEKILTELKEGIIGQDEACEQMCIAFRRPYVVGSDPTKIRNSIILSGGLGTGRHELIEDMTNLLHKYGLSISGEVSLIDMSRYQNQSQEVLFLQDIYMALTSRNPVIVIENFEESSPIFNRMLTQLVIEGRCVLNKRYTFNNNQLQEVTTQLSSNIIDSLSGNDKVLVFLTDKSSAKLMDIFGKTFVDKIQDKVTTSKLNEDDIKKVIVNLLDELKKRCDVQLETELTIDPSINDYLFSRYEPSSGIDSLTPVVNKIYEELVDVVLKHSDIEAMKIEGFDVVKVSFGGEEFELQLIDDASKEREEIQKELDDIVGLDKVKEYLLSLENHIKVSSIRKQKGLKTADVSKHMIFTGNPGTGKTTIARIISRMMKACGILTQGQLVEVTRADLVGKYVGHTAPLTMSVIQSALGGVLFIDEAYSLYRGKDDSFGLEAIDTLVKAMEDHRDDLIVILAGYSKEMEDFLTANSGLKSRFANIIHFDDYTGEELMLISKSVAKGKDYRIDDAALEPLKEYFDKVQARADATSGNGRLARNLVEDAILKQSKRLLENPDDEMDLLLLEDFDLTKVID